MAKYMFLCLYVLIQICFMNTKIGFPVPNNITMVLLEIMNVEYFEILCLLKPLEWLYTCRTLNAAIYQI